MIREMAFSGTLARQASESSDRQRRHSTVFHLDSRLGRNRSAWRMDFEGSHSTVSASIPLGTFGIDGDDAILRVSSRSNQVVELRQVLQNGVQVVDNDRWNRPKNNPASERVVLPCGFDVVVRRTFESIAQGENENPRGAKVASFRANERINVMSVEHGGAIE